MAAFLPPTWYIFVESDKTTCQTSHSSTVIPVTPPRASEGKAARHPILQSPVEAVQDNNDSS